MAQVQFSIKGCKTTNGVLIENESSNFLDAAEGISDIEATSEATKGLDILQKTAAAGGPQVQNIVNRGANGVAGAVLAPSGVSSEQAFGAVNSVNPSAVNNMVGSAEAIKGKIENNDFKPEDIPSYTRDFSNVIKTAKNTVQTKNKEDERVERCEAPGYAQDLINLGVKLNYRFLAHFEMNPPYDRSVGSWDQKFLLHKADRPTISFEYEDVNMYNFRTKVIKSATYQPISMTFYDDQESNTLSFFQQYLQAVSPIANTGGEGNESINYENNVFGYESLKLDTNDANPSAYQAVYNYPSSVGPLLLDQKEIFKTIRLVHIYLGGGKMDVYTLHRPRITEMNMDELDMTATAANAITATIDYDAVNIETYVTSADGDEQREGVKKLINFAGGNNFEPEHQFAAELLKFPDQGDGSSSKKSGSNPNKQSDTEEGILSQAGNAVDNAVSSAQAAAGDVVSAAKGTVNDVIGGAKETVGNAASSVADTAGEFVENNTSINGDGGGGGGSNS